MIKTLKTYPVRRNAPTNRNRDYIYVHDREFSSAWIASLLASTISGWPSANAAIGFPFAISKPVVVNQLGLMVGTAVGPNVDIAIYDEAGANKIVSTGSTARAGTQGVALDWQWINVTDTALATGRYNLVMAADATTASAFAMMNVVSVQATALYGIQDVASSVPLPSTISLAYPTLFTKIPFLGIAIRTPL